MLDRDLKSKIDKLLDLFWSGGIANPLTNIEQISYLIFMKRLDEVDLKNKADAQWLKKDYKSIFPNDNLRWSHFKHMEADAMLTHVRDNVFPFMKDIKGNGESSLSKHMKDAVFLIPKPSLLVEAVEVIENIKIMEQNQDTQGDIYEYLLSKLNNSGTNGQFRTPRHIIKMMCALVNPKIGQTVSDPACGTGGFLIGTYQHILHNNTSPERITIEEDGTEHGLVGDRITDQKIWDFLREKTFFGYEFDSTMLRIAAMNMVLHGIDHPNVNYQDTLSKRFELSDKYDIVLANPPFKGNIDKSDINETLSRIVSTTKTELLFLILMLRTLNNGGRCAVIVPDGVLFGSSNAHVAVRKKIIEDAQLEGVISMPSGVFKPYAGVSTAILIFTKGGETDKVWFYDMEADGFSLDDKRNQIKDNDIPNIVEKWNKRHQLQVPTKGDKWFWVEKKLILENKYDLSINRYKKIEYEEVQYEHPKVILEKLLTMEKEIQKDLEELKEMIG
jgi:type I restriction enzyme M protein